MKSLTSTVIKNSKRQELTNTNKFLSVFSFIIVASFLSVIMIVFSIMSITRLKEYEQAYAFVNILFLMNFLILFSESIFHSLNTLYFSKDLNIFLRLPIKSNDLISAKLKDMIISQYEMEILMLAIPAIVYGLLMNVSIQFYIYLLVILLILPIIPIVITSLIVAIVMRITHFIKNKSKVMYIAIIVSLLILGIILGEFNGESNSISTSAFENLILQANGLAQEIADSFILIKPIMNTLLNYNNIEGLKNLLIYIAESFAIYELGVWLMSKIYLKGAIGTIDNGQKNKKKVKALTEGDVKENNKIKSYLKKEIKITTRSPIFLIQCIIMPIMYPIIVAFLVISILNFAQKIRPDVISGLVQNLNNGVGYVSFFAFAQGFFMLNFSSIIAVSKEGRSAILLKSLPIKLESQFRLKVMIGIVVNSITIFIMCYGYYYFFKNLFFTIMMLISLELLNAFGEKWKLLVDLDNPQINWNTEYTMMKQNTNVMYGLFYTIVVIILIVIAGTILRTTLRTSILLMAILIYINFKIDKFVHSNSQKIFKKLF